MSRCRRPDGRALTQASSPDLPSPERLAQIRAALARAALNERRLRPLLEEVTAYLRVVESAYKAMD